MAALPADDRPGSDTPVVLCSDCAARRAWRARAAVAFACVALGCSYVLGALAVVLARNGGQLPDMPRVAFAVVAPVPDTPESLTGADLDNG